MTMQQNFYNCNVTFNAPMQGEELLPPPPPVLNGTMDECADYIATQTGLPKEMAERMIEAYITYWNDRNNK